MKLKEIQPSTAAHYKTGDDHVCLEGTRIELLESIETWLGHFKSLPCDTPSTLHALFWLYGLAGSGKSSVANSIAQWIEQEGFYLSCFFCRRDVPELSGPRKILPTLAYRLAQQHAGYRTALVDMLGSGSVGAGIVTGDIDKQFELLFKNLLPQVDAPPRAHVIVIDALDECGLPSDQKRLARHLLTLSALTPWIKIIVTSRPELFIRDVFGSSTSCNASNINQEKDTASDIKRYLQIKLALMKTPVSLTEGEVNMLVKQTAGLFIWCSTLLRYIGGSRNPSRDLRRFLYRTALDDPLKQLYHLYDQILNAAIDLEHTEDSIVLRVILGIICITASSRALSARALSNFLLIDSRFVDEDEYSTRNTIMVLHAVLYEDEDRSYAVRVLHPSFLDFLHHKIEQKAANWESFEFLHQLVFRGCMLTLNRELRFNICGVEDSSLFNKDIQDLSERISAHISELLRYSSLFWSSHLLRSGLKASDDDAKAPVFSLLRSTSTLFWLEVLSLLNAVGRGVAILQETAGFFTVFFFSSVILFLQS